VTYEGPGVFTDEVTFTVDGIDLLALLGVDAAELIGPPTRVLCPPSDHLFGGPDRWEDPRDPWFEDGKVAIAGDWCGNPGCRAVLMRVTVDPGQVVWSHFELYWPPSPDAVTETRRLRDVEIRFDLDQYQALIAGLCPHAR
jgi:hypothetical protein